MSIRITRRIHSFAILGCRVSGKMCKNTSGKNKKKITNHRKLTVNSADTDNDDNDGDDGQ